MKNSTFRNFVIRKTDAQNGGSVKDAVFRFEQIDGSYVTDAVTGHDGAIIFTSSELPFGTYKVYEVQAPEGYEIDKTVRTAVWNGTTDVTLYFKDVRKPTVTLLKMDEKTHDSLEGAVFDIYKDDRLITTVKTDNAGYARIPGVTEGYYEAVEISAPEGYITDTERHGIYVDPYNPATEDDPVLIITNSKRPGLVIEKLDAKTLEPIRKTKTYTKPRSAGLTRTAAVPRLNSRRQQIRKRRNPKKLRK